jgi:nucleoside-diphosphate-sugar epimerase
VARPGDIRVSILDAKKAREELGWEPSYGVRTGIEETMDWYLKKNGNSSM